MKRFIIYKITNLLSEKIYVGKHETMNINDSYFGSGTVLKMAIKKYGKENFTKEIIEEVENIENMNIREIYWINELCTISPNGYNINIGGKGGDNFTNNPNKEKIRSKFKIQNLGRKVSDETRRKHSIRMTGCKLNQHRKVRCDFCDKLISQANHNRFHGIYCKENPNRIIKEVKKGTCEFCKIIINISNLKQYHGIYCKENPNRVIKDCSSYKKHSDESYIKANETRILNGNNKQSEETKRKISESLIGRIVNDDTKNKITKNNLERWSVIKEKNIIYKCEYCSIETISYGNYIRWHGEKCRFKLN